MSPAVQIDAVMLSYDEPQADQLHALLEQVLQTKVKRLHGVRGMRRAYRLAAEVASAEQFLLFDGDFEIAADCGLTSVTPLTPGVSMRVWRARNPINGLVYGYGGPKLIRRAALQDLGEAVDVLAALPGRTEFAAGVAGTTRFNQSPFHAWKAGFRECAMLARGSEYTMSAHETAERLAVWTAAGAGQTAQFAGYTARGAQEGMAFATEAARAPAQFDHLNDPAWLHDRFTRGAQAVVTG